MLARVRSAVVGRRPSSTDEAFEEEETGQDDTSSTISQQHKLGMVVDMSEQHFIGALLPAFAMTDKLRFPYSRPEFLYFDEEEVAVSADQTTRPVIVPKDPTRMPVYAGYAEAINAGKTTQNEDAASARILHLVQSGYEAREAVELKNSFSRSSRNNRTASECRKHSTGQSGGKTVSSVPRRHSDDELITVFERRLSIEDGPAIPKAEAAYFGIFDGHAGAGAAIMAANCLHEHIRDRLGQVLETIMHLDRQENFFGGYSRTPSSYQLCNGINNQLSSAPGRSITSQSLVIGALETAFVDMDEQIAEEKQLWKIPGGAAACVTLFFLGKLYVANCGDCRALLVTAGTAEALSQDFTPENERKRLQFLAYRHPELIGSKFTRFEYSRFLTRRDLKKKVLYRDWFMDGWATKTVRENDLKPPLISDRVKKRRLLNTIGVSRGFGDHHLLTVDDKLPIKPFLTPMPEVRVCDLFALDSLSDRDVLILASDGLWDVLTNEEAAMIVRSTLANCDLDDNTRYTLAAQDLVIAARGNPGDGGFRWQLACGGSASCDDICVFVIPLKHAIAPSCANDDDDDVELLQ